jgi:small subunit ribosomal protein S18
MNFEYIEYKDIYLLRRFISMQGKILSRRLNKVSSKQQRSISKSVRKKLLIYKTN